MKRTTQKRLVSKAEYARILARNAMMTTICAICLIIAGLSALACMCIFLYVGIKGFSVHDASRPIVLLLVVFVLSLACGASAKRKVENAEEVQPATRKVVETLPVEDILVRGSEAPQTPETVLLRAASNTAETPQEQLLRPSD